MASIWHGGWGQDRVFLQTLTTHFKRWDCTRHYSVNYRLAGNQGSVTKEFFDEGNKKMVEQYEGKLPWKEI
jgi:hypothetical protein